MTDVSAVYKYLPQIYLSDLVNGFIYLNTFDELAKLEKGLIGDQNERIVDNETGNLVLKDFHDPESKRIRQNLESSGTFQFAENVSNIGLSGITLRTQLLNAHLYCVSKNRNDSHWSESENYDCCVRIKNFEIFCLRIMQNISITHREMLVGDCFYEDNKGNIEKNTFKPPNYFRKTLIHQTQAERRLIILPYSTGIIPFKIRIQINDLVEVLKEGT